MCNETASTTSATDRTTGANEEPEDDAGKATCWPEGAKWELEDCGGKTACMPEGFNEELEDGAGKAASWPEGVGLAGPKACGTDDADKAACWLESCLSM